MPAAVNSLKKQKKTQEPVGEPIPNTSATAPRWIRRRGLLLAVSAVGEVILAGSAAREDDLAGSMARERRSTGSVDVDEEEAEPASWTTRALDPS